MYIMSFWGGLWEVVSFFLAVIILIVFVSIYLNFFKKIFRWFNFRKRTAIKYNNQGIVFLDLEKYNAAIYKFKAAIKLDPKLNVAYYNWGLSLTKSGQFEEAVEVIKKYLELCPQDIKTRKGLGLLLTKIGRYEEAKQYE